LENLCKKSNSTLTEEEKKEKATHMLWVAEYYPTNISSPLLNFEPCDSFSQFMYYVCVNDVESARKELDAGSSANQILGREAVLFYATRNQSVSMCKLLVERGAKIHWSGYGEGDLKTRSTPFLEACSVGNLEILKMFLETRINPNLRHGHNIPIRECRDNTKAIDMLVSHGFTKPLDQNSGMCASSSSSQYACGGLPRQSSGW
jgi:hypothetical protein